MESKQPKKLDEESFEKIIRDFKGRLKSFDITLSSVRSPETKLFWSQTDK